MIYSKERRAEVLAASDAGKGTQEVALLFSVSESWVRRVKQERREWGKIEPKLTRDRTPDWAAHADWLRAKVQQQPDATLLELVALAAAEREWITSDATICRALKALRLTRKKDARPVGARSPGRRRAPRRVARNASGPRSGVSRLPRRNVGQNEHDARLRAERERDAAGREDSLRPLGHDDLPGRPANDGIRRAGVRGGSDQRPRVFSVGQAALGSRAAGAEVRYLPPYSPDLNPIELAFSKFKRQLRDGAKRTADALVDLCGRVLDLFTEAECRNYFRHCGYRYM